MKTLEILEFYKHEVEYNREQVEWYRKQIKYVNRQLERSRQGDKELIEFIWGRGVVTKLDWECFISKGKDYMSGETRKLMNERARYYRKCKYYTKELERRIKQVQEMEG